VDGGLSVRAGYDICERAAEAVRALFDDSAEVLIHAEPAGIDDERLDLRLAGTEECWYKKTAYVKGLAETSTLCHADRAASFHSYCAGLLLPGDRKSVDRRRES
jgi:hypothetical protein